MAPLRSKPSDRPLKRGRTEVKLNDKSSPVQNTFSRFLVMHSEQDEKPLAKLSPFLIAKTLETLVGKNFKAKKLVSGDLLVEVENGTQSAALLDLNKISEYRVSVTPHRTLNNCQGVISEDDLLESSNEEILEGLSSQGVTAVRRILLRKDGNERPTKHIVLTFSSTVLPQSIKAGYLHCKVRPYVPNPRRCFKCQRFGHGSATCRGKTTCAKCACTDHPTDTCGSSTPKCINCTGAHPAYSRSCPKFKEEKEILTLKTKENLSYHEARKRFSFLQGGTYAEAAVRGTRSLSKASVGTQYSLRDTECPPSPLTPTETSVGSQTPEAPQKLTKSKAFPQRLAPKVRVVLDPTRSQVRKGSPPSSTQGVEEAMEVNVPSTEGSMETATPVPSCSKAGNVSSAPQKKSAQASQVPAGSSGRGRAQPTRLTDNARKPGHSDEAVSLRGPEVSTEEKMEEAGLASDDDLLPSGAESLSSSAGEPAERQKDNARKKRNIPRILAPKEN